MVGAELGLAKGQVLLAELEGLGDLAEGRVVAGQVVDASERVGVLGAELGLPKGQRLLV